MKTNLLSRGMEGASSQLAACIRSLRMCLLLDIVTCWREMALNRAIQYAELGTRYECFGDELESTLKDRCMKVLSGHER